MDAGTIVLISFWGGLGILAALGWIVQGVRNRAERRQQERNAVLIRREQAVELRERQLDKREIAIEQFAAEKALGFPWLAHAYEEFLGLQDQESERSLRFKRRPAPKAAEALREISRERRVAKREAKVLEYVLRYYETLFPWLPELRGEDVDDLLISVTAERPAQEDEATDDPARHWLTPAEYETLSNAEKYQLALDWYWKRKKRPWEIGRDYERYVGYLYQQEGFSVYYQGIVEGLEDLGRDLIATSGAHTDVIQCKHWSQHKQIHEKHINQLFGTVTAYKIDHEQQDVRGVFYTSTALSPRARQFADMLGIEVVEGFPLQSYSCIKCNVSRRDGTRIYHLPFDQQYDRTVIEEERLECYVNTVTEAEKLGFRRAFRWRGNESASS